MKVQFSIPCSPFVIYQNTLGYEEIDISRIVFHPGWVCSTWYMSEYVASCWWGLKNWISELKVSLFWAAERVRGESVLDEYIFGILGQFEHIGTKNNFAKEFAEKAIDCAKSRSPKFYQRTVRLKSCSEEWELKIRILLSVFACKTALQLFFCNKWIRSGINLHIDFTTGIYLFILHN